YLYGKNKDEHVASALIKARKYVFSVQQEDGSFIMYPEATEPLVEMTARGIILASLFPSEFMTRKERERIIGRGLIWLVKNQTEKGFFEDQSYSWAETYPISQVALSLFFLERSPYVDSKPYISTIDAIKDKIIEYLKKAQNVDGSYSSHQNLLRDGEQQSTAYAVFTWTLLEPGSDSLIRAINYLISLQRPDRPAQSYPEGTGPRPIRYNDLAHGPIFVSIALLTTLVTCTVLSKSLITNILNRQTT
ncbi:MAG: prenyltransferase/squalene oxidase repeat-containing protein, partial [Promethearchaeota archaeon]